MNSRHLLISVLLFLFSQSLPADSLSVVITFPDNPDTFALDKVRIAGHTEPGAWVFVNNQPARVYPHGAFIARVDLEEGNNLVRVRANRDTLQTVQEISIFRPPKLVDSDTVETVIDTLYCEPKTDIMVMPEDYFRVRIKGSPGSTAWFSVRDLAEEVPMTELPPGEAMGLHGIYQGLLRAGRGPRNQPLEIECRLQGRDGKTLKTILPGKVYVMTDDVPVIGETLAETWLQTGATGFMPIALMPENTRLYIVGKREGKYKVRLSPSLTGWVTADDVALLPWGTDLPVVNISAPLLSENQDMIDLRFPVDLRVPYTLDADLSVPRLELTLYGARQASQWVTWPEKEIAIKHFEFTYPEENVVRIRIEPDSARIWGYAAEYNATGLHVRLNKPPVMPDSTDSLALRNWRIVLDPGHGGENEGAKSPSGYLEKDINLAWARILKDSLESYGAKVILTRNSDSTVSLRERVETARQFKAHLVLSLHNNSTTAGGNAERAQGTSVYYLLPQNKALAWAIYPQLKALGLAPYGRIHNAYYLTKVTDMPVLLIEGAFLSHPEEEQKFRDSKFPRQLSGAIVKGLLNYRQSLSGQNY